MDAVNAEKSKLVQRQKQQKQELEKKVKKLKGAMKEAAAKELEELEEKHEAELAEFDKEKGSGGGASAKPAAAAPAAEAEPAKDAKKFRERHWSGLSKKELEDECVARGIGKKGSKEDLIQKLIIFHQDLATRAAEAGEDSDDRKSDKEDEDSEDEDGSDEEESESDDEDAVEVDQEELERQAKREKLVQKAIVFLFKEKCPGSFPLDELIDKLKMVNVANFAPEKLGYKTLEKFVKGQPPKVLLYDRKTRVISPPKTAASASSS